MYHDEDVPFLEKATNSNDSNGETTPKPTCPRRTWRSNPVLLISLTANVLLGALCVLLAVTHSSLFHSSNFLPELYSPASNAIEYEYRASFNDSTFVGPPGPQWKKAMSKLMAGTLIKLSREELQRANMTSVPLEGEGFAGGLGVAHNLHCVKRIKQFIYFEHFYPDVSMNSTAYGEIQMHADHCLDFIRQDLMCHIDYSLYTLEWGPGPHGDIDLIHQDPPAQRCVNWDKLQQWMHSRSVSRKLVIDPRGLG